MASNVTATRTYRTVDGDAIDLICFREYGISSQVTEKVLDFNYRLADQPIEMQAGIDVMLPPQSPPKLRTLIRLWD